MKTILLIGLGRYGRHIAKKLHELGHEVLGVDRNEEKVDLALPWLTRGLIADSTKLSFLESLSVRSFDLCIVAIGDDFQSSLETTSLLKDMGARMVVARAAKGLHEKFLLRNGADQVVYPEKQLALWTAIRYSSDRVFDYFEIDREHSIISRSTGSMPSMRSPCPPRGSGRPWASWTCAGNGTSMSWR